jgi:hypothetical protein
VLGLILNLFLLRVLNFGDAGLAWAFSATTSLTSSEEEEDAGAAVTFGTELREANEFGRWNLPFDGFSLAGCSSLGASVGLAVVTLCELPLPRRKRFLPANGVIYWISLCNF